MRYFLKIHDGKVPAKGNNSPDEVSNTRTASRIPASLSEILQRYYLRNRFPDLAHLWKDIAEKLADIPNQIVSALSIHTESFQPPQKSSRLSLLHFDIIDALLPFLELDKPR